MGEKKTDKCEQKKKKTKLSATTWTKLGSEILTKLSHRNMDKN